VPDNPEALVTANATAQALVENADRLGLTWDLKPATVTTVSPTIQLIVDGDTASVSVTSMIGDVFTGQRVYVLDIPPAGLFIVGFMAIGRHFVDRQILSSPQSSVIFQIPIELMEVEIGYTARSSNASALVAIRMQINGSAATVYTTETTQGNGAATASSLIDSSGTSAFIGDITGSTSGGGVFGCGKVWFQNWDVPGAASFLNWTFNNAVMASGGNQFVGGGVFASAVQPFNVTLFPASGSFIAGSTFYVKGL